MTITLSSKFQFVIPQEVRKQLNLKAGDKFQVWANRGHIELIPDEPIENFEGRYKGLDLHFEREPDREV